MYISSVVYLHVCTYPTFSTSTIFTMSVFFATRISTSSLFNFRNSLRICSSIMKSVIEVKKKTVQNSDDALGYLTDFTITVAMYSK